MLSLSDFHEKSLLETWSYTFPRCILKDGYTYILVCYNNLSSQQTLYPALLSVWKQVEDDMLTCSFQPSCVMGNSTIIEVIIPKQEFILIHIIWTLALSACVLCSHSMSIHWSGFHQNTMRRSRSKEMDEVKWLQSMFAHKK